MSIDSVSFLSQPISPRYRIDPLTRKAIDANGDGTITRKELREALGQDRVVLHKRRITAKTEDNLSEVAREFLQEYGSTGQAFLSLFGPDGEAAIDGSPLARRSALKLALSVNIADARELLHNYAEVERSIERGAQVLPGQEEEKALAGAMETSNDRILAAAAEGRLAVEEAKQAQQMLDAIADTMDDIHTGKATIELDEEVAGDRRGWAILQPNGDLARVMVRPEQTTQGEARIKFETTGRAGGTLSKPRRMVVRLDHQKINSRAAIDVQFGNQFYGQEGTLDKKIHGLMVDSDGQPKRSQEGFTIPDHHFEGGLPQRLDDPAEFKSYTQRFVEANRLPQY